MLVELAIGAALSLPQPTACQAQALDQVHEQVGTAGFSWVWMRSEKYAGLTYHGPKVIALADDLPCEFVATVSFHEWMHARGVHDEAVADCGASLLLAATEIPNQLDYHSYVKDCTPALNERAQQIIEGED